jgi:hypothetical protein
MQMIPEAMREAFAALQSGEFCNFALLEVTVNGEPAVSIITVHDAGGEYILRPMFVSVTPGMELLDPDGNPAHRIDPQPKAEGDEVEP